MSVIIKDIQRKRKKRQHIFLIVIGMVAFILIVAPIVRHFVCGSFSGDGLLGYYGSIIGSAISLAVAYSAYVQSKQLAEAEEDRAREQRWAEIRPSLQIKVERIENDKYRLYITNSSKYNAINVFLYEYAFLPNVPANKTVEKIFTESENTSKYQYVDPYYFDGLCDDLPKTLWLTYSDIDGNQMQSEFIRRCGIYESTPPDYL